MYSNNRLDLNSKSISNDSTYETSKIDSLSKFDSKIEDIHRTSTHRFSDFKKKNDFIRKHDKEDEEAGENFQGYSKRDNDKTLFVTMTLDRNPSIFDYKVFFISNKLCNVSLNVSVSEIKYKYPPPFEPNGIMFSEIRSVIRAMDYYECDEKFQTQISYRTMLYICYVNFFLLVLAAIIVPITSVEGCGEGLYWRAHFIMFGFLLINFILEVSMFFICMPFSILKDIIVSARGDLKDGANICFATFLAIVINSWFLFSGIIAKIDIYTDMGFALEVLS